MTGAGKPLTHGSGDEYGSVRPAKYVQRLLPPDCVAGGVVMCPDSKRRGHPGQQRWMPEAFTRLEDVHHLVLVAELDRAAANDEKLLRRGAVLDKNVGARRVGPDRYRRGDAREIVPAKLVEWGKKGKKAGSLFNGAYRRADLTLSSRGSGESYDHDRWAKLHKKTRGGGSAAV